MLGFLKGPDKRPSNGTARPALYQPGQHLWAWHPPRAVPCKDERGSAKGDLHPGLQESLSKNHLLVSWPPWTQERAVAAQAAASATLPKAPLHLLSCSETAEKEKQCMEGAVKSENPVGGLTVLSWASKLFAFKMEAERKQSFFENVLECQGFPGQSFILLLSGIPMDACHGTKKQGGDTGNVPTRGGRKVHAVCAHHAAAEMLKAREIPTVELLWLHSEHSRGIK